MAVTAFWNHVIKHLIDLIKMSLYFSVLEYSVAIERLNSEVLDTTRGLSLKFGITDLLK